MRRNSGEADPKRGRYSQQAETHLLAKQMTMASSRSTYSSTSVRMADWQTEEAWRGSPQAAPLATRPFGRREPLSASEERQRNAGHSSHDITNWQHEPSWTAPEARAPRFGRGKVPQPSAGPFADVGQTFDEALNFDGHGEARRSQGRAVAAAPVSEGLASSASEATELLEQLARALGSRGFDLERLAATRDPGRSGAVSVQELLRLARGVGVHTTASTVAALPPSVLTPDGSVLYPALARLLPLCGLEESVVSHGGAGARAHVPGPQRLPATPSRWREAPGGAAWPQEEVVPEPRLPLSDGRSLAYVSTKRHTPGPAESAWGNVGTPSARRGDASPTASRGRQRAQPGSHAESQWVNVGTADEVSTPRDDLDAARLRPAPLAGASPSASGAQRQKLRRHLQAARASLGVSSRELWASLGPPPGGEMAPSSFLSALPRAGLTLGAADAATLLEDLSAPGGGGGERGGVSYASWAAYFGAEDAVPTDASDQRRRLVLQRLVLSARRGGTASGDAGSLMAAFSRLDAGGKGLVSLRAFGEGLSQLGVRMSEADLRTAAVEIDPEGGGASVRYALLRDVDPSCGGAVPTGPRCTERYY